MGPQLNWDLLEILEKSFKSSKSCFKNHFMNPPLMFYDGGIVFVENYGNRVPVHLMTPKLCPTKPGPRKLSPARKCPYDIVPLNYLSQQQILTIFKDFHFHQL